jgi:hypothetical protein
MSNSRLAETGKRIDVSPDYKFDWIAEALILFDRRGWYQNDGAPLKAAAVNLRQRLRMHLARMEVVRARRKPA